MKMNRNTNTKIEIKKLNCKIRQFFYNKKLEYSKKIILAQCTQLMWKVVKVAKDVTIATLP
jgi:hypothetical protein